MTDEAVLRRHSLTRSSLVIAVTVFTTAVPFSTCIAQQDDGSGVWGLVGAEWMGVGGELAAGVQGELGYRTGRLCIGGRMLYATGVDLTGWGESEQSRELFEVGPVVGVQYGWRFLKAQANIGISLVSGRLLEESTESKKSATGVPVEAGLFVVVRRAPRVFGIGVGGFGNLAVKSFGGLGVFFLATR
jgi:hypothetical protein